MYPEKASQFSNNLPGSMIEHNPDEWITGTEAMTIEQRIYLKTLSEEAGEYFDGTLSKVSAQERIKVLQLKIAGKL